MRLFSLGLLLLPVFAGSAAELFLGPGDAPEGKAPPGFRSALTGSGKPGDWKVVYDAEVPLVQPIAPQAPSPARKAVIAQLSRDPSDDRYPLLIYEGGTFGDFTLSTRFKLVDGSVEQMAGIAFRIQDEKNYYYVRASGLGGTFQFWKFVKGELLGPIGSKVQITRGVWHDLAVECRGSQITCSLDGKPIIAEMQQDTFPKGKVGFWTKSDSVSYFADTKITYRPLEAPIEAVIRNVAASYPRLLGLKVYVRDAQPGSTRVVAAKDSAEIKAAGGKTEDGVLRTGETYYGKEKDTVSVIMPLRDRNGDVLAAVRVVMKSFKGQTEANAIIRAAPIVKEIQARVTSMDDLAP